MSEVEIQVGGFGGQGVILAAMAIGRGLVLYEDHQVSLTQSFGPEARGSACSAQLVVSREPVMYPYLSKAASIKKAHFTPKLPFSPPIPTSI